MSAARWPILGLCVILVACGPSSEASLASTESGEASASPSAPSPEPTSTPTPHTTATAAPSVEPPSPPQPTPFMPPSSVEPVALPDGLDRFAWATVVVESGDATGTRTYRLFAGRLGSAASHEELVQDTRHISTVVDRDVVAVLKRGRDQLEVGLRRIDGWAGITTFTLPALYLDLTLDTAREVVYAGFPNADGGLDITRFGFDGTATKLLVLDERFATFDLAPDDQATLTVDGEGVLLIEACGESDGCRLWTVPPSAPAAGTPVRLPSGTPGVCQAIGATETWLVVSDSLVCGMDYFPAPLPYRAISRLDGSSHPLSNEPLALLRVLRVDDKATAVGRTWSDDLSTTDVVAIDVASGAQRTVASGLRNLANFEGWLSVDEQVLVGSWVLVSPSSAYYLAPPNAVLINVETGQQIELPIGTFGYRS